MEGLKKSLLHDKTSDPCDSSRPSVEATHDDNDLPSMSEISRKLLESAESKSALDKKKITEELHQWIRQMLSEDDQISSTYYHSPESSQFRTITSVAGFESVNSLNVSKDKADEEDDWSVKSIPSQEGSDEQCVDVDEFDRGREWSYSIVVLIVASLGSVVLALLLSWLITLKF